MSVTEISPGNLGSRVKNKLHAHARTMHRDTLERSNSRARIPVTDTERTASHNLLGTYYEFMHARLHGGKPVKLLTQGESRRLPDVIDLENKIMTEVKGCRVDSQCQLRNSQVAYYEKIQAAYPDWTINLAIYRHAFAKIKEYSGPEDALYATLGQKTLYACIMPFPTMLGIHRAENMGDLVRKYTQSTNPKPGAHIYETCTCMQPATPHKIFQNPEAFIDRTGYSAKEFSIGRYWTREEFQMQGRHVAQFPITMIAHNTYANWAQQFCEQYNPDDTEISDAAEEDPDLTELSKIIGPPYTSTYDWNSIVA